MMKTLRLAPFFLAAFLLCNYTLVAQGEIIEEVQVESEVSTITASYNGIEDKMFVFEFKDENGEEDFINFNKISPLAKQQFDLAKKEMIGKIFEITYSNINEEEEDDDNEIDYVSVKTILTLKKL